MIGQAQETLQQKTGVEPKPRRLWDEERLLASLGERESDKAAAIGKAILDWVQSHADRCTFNDAPTFGAATAEAIIAGEPVPSFKVWTDGNMQLLFTALARTKAYAASEARALLLQRIAEVWALR